MLTSETTAPGGAPVRLSALIPDQGIRRKLIERDLITPLDPVVRGRAVRVSADDAERVQRAIAIAAATGIAVFIVLKVLNSLP